MEKPETKVTQNSIRFSPGFLAAVLPHFSKVSELPTERDDRSDYRDSPQTHEDISWAATHTLAKGGHSGLGKIN